MSLSESVCGPFKRNCQRLQQFLSFTVSIPTGFYSLKLWRLIFLALEPWAGAPGVGLGPFPPEIHLLIFICHIRVCDQPSLCLWASYQSRTSFFNSIVVGLPFSLISNDSERIIPSPFLPLQDFPRHNYNFISR